MTPSQDPPRWLDGAGDAPAGFEALVRDDEALGLDPTRLSRVAEGLGTELGRPALAAAAKHELLTSKTNGFALTAKLAGALAVLGVAAWIGLSARDDAPAPAVPAAPEAQAAPAPAAPWPEPRAQDMTAQDTPARIEIAPAPKPKPKPEPVPERAQRPAAGPKATAAALDPAAELALLERAQRKLRADPRGALALTRQHAEAFGRGQFEQEREMIAIEALLELGQRAQAERRGRAFLRAHPQSSHAPRLQGLLATAPGN